MGLGYTLGSLVSQHKPNEGNNMKVRNVGSNMTEVITEKGQILFSYETPVAAILCKAPEGLDEGCTVVKTSHKWSPTTSRHINKWLDGLTASEQPQDFFDNLV